MKKRIAMIAIFGAAVISTWLIYSRVTQNRREKAYRSALAPYQRDLPPGIAREDVDKYLDTRYVPHYPASLGNNNGVRHQIKIREDPSSLVCEWNVYIVLSFSPADVLTDIRIEKEGTCL